MEKSKVTFSCYYDVNGAKYPRPSLTGIFQRWGDTVVYQDEKCFARTVGIVLGDDGKVYETPPDAITVIAKSEN